MLKDKVGDRIRTARIRRGLTQAELGERAGLTESWVAGAERYRPEIPDFEKLAALAKVLDVPIRYLAEPIGWYEGEADGGDWILRMRGDPTLTDESKQALEMLAEQLRLKGK